MDKKGISILIFLIILPFFCPSYITVHYDRIADLFKIGRYVSAAVILIISLRSLKLSKVGILILLFCSILSVNTLINKGDIPTLINEVLPIFSLVLLTEYYLRNNFKLYIKTFLFLFEILVVINFITMILHPEGLYTTSLYTLNLQIVTGYTENWFLGYRNIHILIILPTLVFSFLYSYMDGEKIKLRTKLLIIISTISVLMGMSATTIIGTSIFLILVLFKDYFIRFTKMNIKTFIIIVVTMFLGIVIFRVQNFLTFFITGIFDRSMTFTGRTYIWDNVMESIKNSPLFGYGIEHRVDRVLRATRVVAYHAHNAFLEILFRGGIVLLTSFSLIIFNSAKSLLMEKNNLTWLLSVTIFTYLMMMQFEAYSMVMFMVIIVIGYNWKYLIDKKEDEVHENS